MPDTSKKEGYRRKRHRTRDKTCHCCTIIAPFCWTCRCGFRICQVCMDENVWGMSCNGITWQCPDCGEQNGFGNQ
ncbi:MAG: hypothetical protein JRH03_05155 [Deltaproteobacteria bacterium]|nr:hypothetical protein [Deltaproteobacteria bacterium]MBW2612807.1 hypothetical protein [Deltaproteobacteria bacterium]